MCDSSLLDCCVCKQIVKSVLLYPYLIYIYIYLEKNIQHTHTNFFRGKERGVLDIVDQKDPLHVEQYRL